jgi:tetratricopeptide (TPR) repeat protein
MRPFVRIAAISALLLGCSLSAQPPGGTFVPGGGAIERSPMFGILLHKAIQDDLKIDEAQAAKLAAIANQVRVDYKQKKAELTEKATLAIRDADELAKRILKRLEEAESKVLTNKQVVRLKQISVQLLENRAFQDREIVALLMLSEEQNAGMEKIQKEMVSAWRDIRPEVTKEIGRMDMEKFNAEVNKRIAKLTAESVEKMAALLDGKQKVIWKKLVGEPSAAVPLSGGFPVGSRHFTVWLIESECATGEIKLLEAPALAKELKLSQEEARQLKAIPEALEKEFGMDAEKAVLDKINGTSNFWKLNSRMATEARDRANNNVLRATQVKRLRQIERQREDLPLFEDYEVLDALKLTPDQAEVIEKASKWIRGGGTEGITEAKGIRVVVGTFSTEQNKALAEMMGKPFDFAKAEGLSAFLSQSRISERGFGVPAALSPAMAYAKKAEMLMEKGEYARSLVAYEEAIRLGQKHYNGYNGKAYLLAVCPDANLRDGKQAITLAKKALELAEDNGDRVNILDTLACAYAEVGDFENAVKMAEEAMKKGRPSMKAEFEKMIKRFRERKPYHLDPVKK